MAVSGAEPGLAVESRDADDPQPRAGRARQGFNPVIRTTCCPGELAEVLDGCPVIYLGEFPRGGSGRRPRQDAAFEVYSVRECTVAVVNELYIAVFCDLY
jgi:hypothetical protein